MSKPAPAARRRAAKLLADLKARYPDAHCALIHEGPFQLLIATILSAQCTDKLVNQVTPALFKSFPDAQAMAAAPLAAIEEKVNRVNFWRNKAKFLKATAELLMAKHGGEVPADMAALVKLSGVARKTANVVLGNAFGINHGVVVDTHVGRLSRRFGLTASDDPKKIETDLMGLFPREDWTLLSHLFIEHGRQVCKARHGLCAADAICREFHAQTAAKTPAKAKKPTKKQAKKAVKKGIKKAAKNGIGG